MLGKRLLVKAKFQEVSDERSDEKPRDNRQRILPERFQKRRGHRLKCSGKNGGCPDCSSKRRGNVWVLKSKDGACPVIITWTGQNVHILMVLVDTDEFRISGNDRLKRPANTAAGCTFAFEPSQLPCELDFLGDRKHFLLSLLHVREFLLSRRITAHQVPVADFRNGVLLTAARQEVGNRQLQGSRVLFGLAGFKVDDMNALGFR